MVWNISMKQLRQNFCREMSYLRISSRMSTGERRDQPVQVLDHVHRSWASCRQANGRTTSTNSGATGQENPNRKMWDNFMCSKSRSWKKARTTTTLTKKKRLDQWGETFLMQANFYTKLLPILWQRSFRFVIATIIQRTCF